MKTPNDELAAQVSQSGPMFDAGDGGAAKAKTGTYDTTPAEAVRNQVSYQQKCESPFGNLRSGR